MPRSALGSVVGTTSTRWESIPLISQNYLGYHGDGCLGWSPGKWDSVPKVGGGRESREPLFVTDNVVQTLGTSTSVPVTRHWTEVLFREGKLREDASVLDSAH